MKLPAFVLLGSVAANAAFAVFYFSRDAAPPRPDAAREGAIATQRAAAQAKTQVAREANAQAQLWPALASDDLKTLVARLRAAGFPPGIIRAVVTARIQTRFSARLKAFATSIESTPFWKPALNSTQATIAKYNAERSQIYRERSAALREVLGDDFFGASAGEVTAAQRRQYGDLSKSKIDLIQRIADDYDDMTAQVRGDMLGIMLPSDREKLALLEREKHSDLAAILSPQELEGYEMRSSQLTSRLRGALTAMDATEAEFGTIFKIQQPFDAIVNPSAATMTAEMGRQRTEAMKQMNDQIKAALGDARGADYVRASNYEFQNLIRLTQRENLPVANATTVYDLRSSAAEASQRIDADKVMTYEQKLAALKSMAETTQAQLTATLGPKAGPTYAQSADWLRLIANGSVITIQDNGMSINSVRPPRPATPPSTPRN